MRKRSAQILIALILFIVCASLISNLINTTQNEKVLHIKTYSVSSLRQKPIENAYYSYYSEPVFENLNMIGNVTDYGVDNEDGKISRAMRFKNVADAVQRHYGIKPKNLILAMVCQETGGADLLPNSSDDGGIGLCHMQGSTAYTFGLHTYNNCNELVCTEDGEKLRALIQECGRDLKKLITYDDRFNVLLNLDAVGRILAESNQKDNIPNYTELQSAICRYSGFPNYKRYMREVNKYLDDFNENDYLESVEKRFNEINPDLTINGEHADFKEYIKVCNQQNFNYGLQEYLNLGKYNPEKKIAKVSKHIKPRT